MKKAIVIRLESGENPEDDRVLSLETGTVVSAGQSPGGVKFSRVSISEGEWLKVLAAVEPALQRALVIAQSPTIE